MAMKGYLQSCARAPRCLLAVALLKEHLACPSFVFISFEVAAMLSGLRILVVEDEALVAEHLFDILTEGQLTCSLDHMTLRPSWAPLASDAAANEIVTARPGSLCTAIVPAIC